ncbi:uncharacterized protein LOC105689461 [Athalia rosae]|uniref:uncharacterized protein LOC105689461 n=1 Tax=Athalia rosae TaxID=37344 RepID=UPI0020341F66|nr:uncharacterized protein LOC105689461 [Athalia rosae]
MSAANGSRDDSNDSLQNKLFEDPHLQDYLERVAKILKISGAKYDIMKSGSNKGDNYVGVLHRIIIEGKKNGIPTKVPVIMKVPPKNETSRMVVQIDHLFPREHYFYAKIVPTFNEFLKTHNKLMENIPECYFSTSDNRKEAVCLEDLGVKGFVMRDRLKEMDFAHASIIMKTWGRFHALSFALRDQRPDIFKSEIAAMKEALWRPEVVQHPDVVTRVNTLGKYVKMALAQENSKYLEKFTKFLSDVPRHLETSCDGSLAEPYAVLNHGDSWSNNMMFRYEEGSDEPKDIYMIDFQLCRYASPASDISYILYTSCSNDLRKNHFDELIKIYYDSLSSYLLELGSDPEKLFPFEALLKQLKIFSTYVAGMGILIMHALTSEPNDVQDFDPANFNPDNLEERLKRDHFWRNTLRDVYKDLIDRDFI